MVTLALLLGVKALQLKVMVLPAVRETLEPSTGVGGETKYGGSDGIHLEAVVQLVQFESAVHKIPENL